MSAFFHQIKPSIPRIDPFDPPHSSVSFLNKVSLGVVPAVQGLQGLPNRQKINQKDPGRTWKLDAGSFNLLERHKKVEMIPVFGF